MESKFVGCMLGCALGDALGSRYEGRFTNGVTSAVTEFVGRWTDDTHMMIGVAESLIECRGFNGEHMAWTFIRNWQREPWRGYGPGPPRVFKKILSGVPWFEAAKKLYGNLGSLGNGGAMRIAPIALLYYDDEEELREIAYKCAAITHAHELGMEGAAVQAYAIALALRVSEPLSPRDYLEEVARFSKSDVYQGKLKKAIQLLDEEDRRVVIRELGNGVEAPNSVPTAIYCFARNHDSYVKTVLYAVSLGGDTDTIAAMAGAIAGAHLGEEGLPREWIQSLEKAEYIKKLAKGLWALKKSLKADLESS
ncbi:MAG: ADP-ribosylglycohydrolase family protein [Candidatus Verstraetearchaeota archaeon]|nr:ADP-ribosylglycohydrolase family protein [Candidatus Verstraetearchaeota archaeon]